MDKRMGLRVAPTPAPLALEAYAHDVDGRVLAASGVTKGALALRAEAVAGEFLGTREPKMSSPSSVWASCQAEWVAKALDALEVRPMQIADPVLWAVLAKSLQAANCLLVIRDVAVPGKMTLDELLTAVCLRVRICALAVNGEGRNELAKWYSKPLYEEDAFKIADPVRNAVYTGYGMEWIRFCEDAGRAACRMGGAEDPDALFAQVADAAEKGCANLFAETMRRGAAWDARRSDVAYLECAFIASSMWATLFRVEMATPVLQLCRVRALAKFEEDAKPAEGGGEDAGKPEAVSETAPQMLF